MKINVLDDVVRLNSEERQGSAPPSQRSSAARFHDNLMLRVLDDVVLLDLEERQGDMFLSQRPSSSGFLETLESTIPELDTIIVAMQHS